MKNLKVGDNLINQCYKHNGVLHKMWDKTTVLDIKKDCLVLGNNNVLVTKQDGKKWRTKETAIIFFYTNRWFNVIAQMKKDGIYYYCNITSPFIIDNNILKFIDYDLDLRVFPNGRYKVLDRNEYNYHKHIMNYPKEINMIINSELNSLIEMKKNNIGPFDKNVIQKYYEQYLKIMKEDSN